MGEESQITWGSVLVIESILPKGVLVRKASSIKFPWIVYIFSLLCFDRIEIIIIMATDSGSDKKSDNLQSNPETEENSLGIPKAEFVVSWA